MKSYTVGFVFDSSLEEVALILKTHPDWQKGKLNGIGGRIEEGETSLECIVREIKEETGLSTEPSLWQHFATIYENEAKVDILALKYGGPKDKVKTKTDEKVSWYNAKDLPEKTVQGVSWLIPLAFERLRGTEFEVVEVRYN